jgi:putative hydrolase of the HAD superfamily
MSGGIWRQVTHILLFDLDETLYPPDAGVMDRIRDRMQEYVCSHLGLTPAEADELRRRYLRDYGTTLRGLQINHMVDAEEYLRLVHDVPLERLLRTNPELDGVLSGMPLQKVVFTNSSREHAERVLALLGIRRHFGRIVDIRDMQFESKPQPEAYGRVCQLLDVRPEDCVIVEDSVRNLQPAKALGMTTILVQGGEAVAGEGIDVVIRRIEEIGEALRCLGFGQSQRGTQPGAEGLA